MTKRLLTGISRFFPFMNLLSIDVCAGAAAGGYFALYVTNAQLGYPFYVILFLAVFFIYSTDHVLDARKTGANAGRSRLRFYYIHFKVILLLSFAAGGVTLFLALNYLSRQVIYGGLLVAAGVAIHLVFAQFAKALSFIKEFSVALYYTAGIWLAPVLLNRNEDTLSLCLNIVLFYLTALQSLILFSWMEIEEDKRDGSHSLAVFLGKKKIGQLIRLLMAAGYALIAYFAFLDLTGNFVHYYWLPALVIFTVHLLFFLFPAFFYRKDYFRIFGDGCFMIYAVVYWF